MAKEKTTKDAAAVQEAETVEVTLEDRVRVLADQVMELTALSAKVDELYKWAQSVDAVVAKNIPYIDAAALFAFHSLDKQGAIVIPEEWTPGFAKEAQAKIADIVKLIQGSDQKLAAEAEANTDAKSESL